MTDPIFDDEPVAEPQTAIVPVDNRPAMIAQGMSQAQIQFLTQRTPKHEIKHRKGRGGEQYAYIEGGYVIEVLNNVFGWNWDFDVVDKQMFDDELMVEGMLTVRTPSGQTIRKRQFGGQEILRYGGTHPRAGQPISIADDYKKAATDALKKCASLLGIGLDVYGRDDYGNPDPTPQPPAHHQAPQQRPQPQPQPQRRPEGAVRERGDFEPVSPQRSYTPQPAQGTQSQQTGGSPITEKQRKAIFAISKARGIAAEDLNVWVEEVFGAHNYEQLSSADASTVIDKLNHGGLDHLAS